MDAETKMANVAISSTRPSHVVPLDDAKLKRRRGTIFIAPRLSYQLCTTERGSMDGGPENLIMGTDNFFR